MSSVNDLDKIRLLHGLRYKYVIGGTEVQDMHIFVHYDNLDRNVMLN